MFNIWNSVEDSKILLLKILFYEYVILVQFTLFHHPICFIILQEFSKTWVKRVIINTRILLKLSEQ